MFKFLKLHSSSSGDARRHVPFASIIHKHIFPVFFVTILFLTLFFRPYSAEALAQLVPEIQPVYDTTIESLYEFVKVQLDDTNRQVFDLFLGSYMVGYAGMSDYKLNYTYNSDTPVKEWLINSGADLYNTILSLGGLSVSSGSNYLGVPKIGAKELSPLLQTAMGCALKAKTYNDVDAAYTDITTADAYPIPLSVDIMYSINAAMGYTGGLYEWQFNDSPFSNLTFTKLNMSGAQQATYDTLVSQLTTPHVLYNAYYPVYGDNYYNVISDSLGEYYLFFNTSTGQAYLCDSLGIQISSYKDLKFVRCGSNGSPVLEYGRIFFNSIYFSNDSRSFAEITNDYFTRTTNDTSQLAVLSNRQGGGTWFAAPLYNYFVKGVYSGSSWNNKTQVLNETDLNLERPNQPTFLQGVENGLLDLKGLLEDILGELELRPPVINNYYYPDGSNVPVSDIEPAMQNNTLPESGVDIDQNLFAPLFTSDGKKSYISYLWYMTKPLVLYTKDLFSCLVFDPVADFAASGPGYFVYGVVGLGLISGLLVKCLL